MGVVYVRGVQRSLCLWILPPPERFHREFKVSFCIECEPPVSSTLFYITSSQHVRIACICSCNLFKVHVHEMSYGRKRVYIFQRQLRDVNALTATLQQNQMSGRYMYRQLRFFNTLYCCPVYSYMYSLLCMVLSLEVGVWQALICPGIVLIRLTG